MISQPIPLVRTDSQDQLRDQDVDTQLILPDRLGGLEPKTVSVKGNENSATVLFTRWAENLLIPHSPIAYLSNCVMVFTLGAFMYPLASLSMWVSLFLTPIVFVYFGLGYLTQNSHLEKVFWLYSGLAFVGFILAVIIHLGL